MEAVTKNLMELLPARTDSAELDEPKTGLRIRQLH